MDKLDILNRDIFVDRLLQLVENISDNKSATCFAINGTWGCGKSFVLDMFEEKLMQIQSEETASEKYFVIRYDSWKYDYYEEPLVAIVATLISEIEEKTRLFPDGEEKQAILGILKAAGVSLLSAGNIAVKEKTGIDLQKAFTVVVNGAKEGIVEYEKNHEYDVYFGFNKVVQELINSLHKIAQRYTIVLIVDELDRCLPEYTIKVLERLHHLTEGQTNIITIISIDKSQLMTSVQKTFGFDNPEKYLEKFINFEIELDTGTVSEKITEKYREYIALFDEEKFAFEDSVEECLQAIFKDIDVRKQEQIFKKATLAHKLLYSDKKDYSFMCMELLVAVMICVYNDTSCYSKSSVNFSSFDRVFLPFSNSTKPAFSDFFKEKFEKVGLRLSYSAFSDEAKEYVLPEKVNLYGAILFTWYWMHEKHPRVILLYNKNGVYEPIVNNYVELEKYVEMMRMIK